MKKLLAFVITAVLALGLLSCGGNNESQKEGSTPEQTESISASERESTQQSESESTQQSESESTQQSESESTQQSESESTQQSESESESSSEAVINGEVLEAGRITAFIPEGWSLIDLGAYTDEFTAVILKGTQEDFMEVPQISIIYMVPTEMAISAAAYYDNVIQQSDFDMGNYHWTSWTGSSSGLKSFVAEAEGEFGFISVNLQQVEPDGEMPSIEDEEVKAIIKSIKVRPTAEIDWIKLDGNTATAELKAYEGCHWVDSGNMAQQGVDVDYEIEGNAVTFTSNAGTGGFKLQLVLVNDDETLKYAEAHIDLKLEDGKFDAVYSAAITEYDEPESTDYEPGGESDYEVPDEFLLGTWADNGNDLTMFIQKADEDEYGYVFTIQSDEKTIVINVEAGADGSLSYEEISINGAEAIASFGSFIIDGDVLIWSHDEAAGEYDSATLFSKVE